MSECIVAGDEIEGQDALHSYVWKCAEGEALKVAGVEGKLFGQLEVGAGRMSLQ